MAAFCFQNKAKITLRQAFLAIYILCKSVTATYNILILERINLFEESAMVAMLFFNRSTKFYADCFHSHKHSLQIW